MSFKLSLLCAQSIFILSSSSFAFSLQDAINTAFKENPITQSNDLRLMAAKDRARAARLGMLPSGALSVSQGFNHYTSNYNGISTSGRSASDSWAIGVSANLYRGGADIYCAKAAQKSAERLEATNNSTNALIPDTKGALAIEVFNAYLGLVSNANYYDFYEERKRTLQLFLQAAQNEDEKNLIETAIAETENALLGYRNNLQTFKDVYEDLVKMPLPSRLDNLDETSASLTIPRTAELAVQVALNKSPDILVAQTSLEIAKLDHKALYADSYSPRVDLSLSRGRSTSEESGSRSRSYGTTAYLTVSFPFGASTRAYNSASRREVEATEKDFDKVRDRLIFSISKSHYPSLAYYTELSVHLRQTYAQVSENLNRIIQKIEKGEKVDIENALSQLGSRTNQFFNVQQNQELLIRTKFEIQKTIGTLFELNLEKAESGLGSRNQLPEIN